MMPKKMPKMPKVIDTPIEVHDSRMDDLVDAKTPLIQLDDSSQHSEGPVYIPGDGDNGDSVVWSDVSGDRVLKWQAGQVTLLRACSHFQNGNAIDLEGRIVGCSHGDRAIVRQEHSGEWRILIERYQGKRLNSPNDITVKSDGTLWFTDPPFGLTQSNQGCGGEQEQSGSFVYRFDPATNEIEAVITDMTRPNGLAFSPDESLLYVSDTSAYEDPHMYHDIRIYDVVKGRQAANGRIFAVIDPGQPDGLCVDRKGNLFISSEDSVQIYSPEGHYLGKIPVPEICANLTFGQRDQKNRLFIAAGGSLYAIDLKTQGVSLLSAREVLKK